MLTLTNGQVNDMKKALCLLTVLLLLLTLFSGCSGDRNGETEVLPEETTVPHETETENASSSDAPSAGEMTEPTAPAGASLETELLYGVWSVKDILSAETKDAEVTAQIDIYENSAAYWTMVYPFPGEDDDGEEESVMYYDIVAGDIGKCDTGWYAFLSAGQNGETLVKAELKDETVLYIEVQGTFAFTAECERVDSFGASERSFAGKRELMLNDDIAAGIAYLGKAAAFDRMNVLGLLFNNDMISAMPFAADIPPERYVDAGGTDVFCVIPFANDATVAVNKLESDSSVSDVYYRSEEGKPILIACEAQDGNAHVQLNVCDHRTNGTVNLSLVEPSGILDTFDAPEFADMTIYRDLETEKLLSGIEGGWHAEVTAPDGTAYSLLLTFYEDGGMEYAYGYPMSDILESFNGIYYVKKLNSFSQYAPGEMSFDLTLTGGAASENVEPYDFYGGYVLGLTDDGRLSVTHLDEDCLIYGMDGSEFIFSRAAG